MFNSVCAWHLGHCVETLKSQAIMPASKVGRNYTHDSGTRRCDEVRAVSC